MNPLYLSRAVLISYDGEEPPASHTCVHRRGLPRPVLTLAASQWNSKTKSTLCWRPTAANTSTQKEAILAEAASKTSLSAEDRASLEQQLAGGAAEPPKRRNRARRLRRSNSKSGTKELASEKKAREDWETRYKQGTVEQAHQDAAIQRRGVQHGNDDGGPSDL